MTDTKILSGIECERIDARVQIGDWIQIDGRLVEVARIEDTRGSTLLFLDNGWHLGGPYSAAVSLYRPKPKPKPVEPLTEAQIQAVLHQAPMSYLKALRAALEGVGR